MRIPMIPLKIMVLMHQVLILWSFLRPLGAMYVTTNLVVLGVGYWTIATPKSATAAESFFVTLFFSIINDCISLGVNGSDLLHAGANEQFSVAMAIINIIVKPLTMVFVFQVFRDRGGQFGLVDRDSQGSSSDYESIPAPQKQNAQSSSAPQQQYTDEPDVISLE
eukprot:CAMPEP_0201551874 /NCGR_PEP_ID=MMETSP0173_2-20130828/11766_1 /ASSEMBLY_ACC=CAM_ASM_000268 /TAXON_ID=218659 /ORGANISM="Vexillifera sp., Strain DIVA3 564/2" /LENGTH=164 /DNA_ID=CAMNT_0047962227 /DNA_START=43 /DNA_END=537 /DNA_ORIENTATION=-